MKVLLTLTVGVLTVFAGAYGIYVAFVTVLLGNYWYTGAMMYLVFAASIGSGSLIRMIHE
jgi:hypothetical protein